MMRLILILFALTVFACKSTTGDLVESKEESLEKVSLYDSIIKGAFYTQKDSVAMYLCKFSSLPENYVTKAEGIALYEALGNTFSKWNFNPWTTLFVMIGGDTFTNADELLPDGVYREADVNYSGKNRGTNRLVYSSPCTIYYTADHYQTYVKLDLNEN